MNRSSCSAITSHLLWTLLTVMIAQTASADDALQLPEQSEPRATTFQFDAFGEYFLRADVDDTGSDVSVGRVGGEVSMRHRASDSLVVLAGLRLEVAEYDFGDPAGLYPGAPTSGDPLGELYEARFTLGFQYMVDKDWSVIGTGFARSSHEGGARFEDSITGGGILGFGYNFTERFTLQLGVGVLTRLEDSTTLIPLIGVRWQITDDLLLASEALGLRLTWTAHEDVSINAFAKYSSRDYRLDRDNATLSGGVLRDDRLLLGLGGNWRPAPAISLGVEAGASLWQRFRFYDDSGTELSDPNTDPQFFMGASFVWRF